LLENRPRVQVTRPLSPADWRLERAPTGLQLGQRVQHPNFGEGVVLDYEGSGAQARVQVNFRSAGAKWLVVAYANLRPV